MTVTALDIANHSIELEQCADETRIHIAAPREISLRPASSRRWTCC